MTHAHQGKRLLILLFGILLSLIDPASAETIKNPLEAVDTSSPRSTFLGFIKKVEERYEITYGEQGLLQRYLRSGRLFPEKGLVDYTRLLYAREIGMALKYLDLRGVPDAILKQTAWRLCTQLKEILDRLPQPDAMEIPDAEAASKLPGSRWTVPASEIQIGLIDSGPSAGQYLFTQETISQIPKYFEKIKDSDYISTKTTGLYNDAFLRPTGMALFFLKVIPPRWFLGIPESMDFEILQEPVWKWISFLLMTAVLFSVIYGSYRLVKRFLTGDPVKDKALMTFPVLLSVALIPEAEDIISDVLRLSPTNFSYLSRALWAYFYLAISVIVWRFSGLMAVWIIGYERIHTDSTDSQLIKLTSRLIAVTACAGILIDGGSRIGLPSYSVFAGIGLSGLAFAIAGQQALANLISSLIIMTEKPFRIGDYIKTDGRTAKVIGIGFRSTHLKTLEGSQVIIPSSDLLRLPVENFSVQDLWPIKKRINISVKTPGQKIEQFKERISDFLQDHADINPNSVQVWVSDITPQGVQIDFFFQLCVLKSSGQAAERSSELLLAIRTLAEQLDIELYEAGFPPTKL